MEKHPLIYSCLPFCGSSKLQRNLLALIFLFPFFPFSLLCSLPSGHHALLTTLSYLKLGEFPAAEGAQPSLRGSNCPGERVGLLAGVKRGGVSLLPPALAGKAEREIRPQGHLSSHFGIAQPAGEELEIRPVPIRGGSETRPLPCGGDASCSLISSSPRGIVWAVLSPGSLPFPTPCFN